MMSARFRHAVGENRLYRADRSATSRDLEITAASFAYPHHDGAARAAIASRLHSSSGLDNGFVLSTCLRVEVAVSGDETKLDEALRSLFGGLIDETPPQVRRAERAVTHLYRIAAGLESPILGEQEILTQFRQSLIAAEDSGQVGGVFAKVLETAVAAGRQARELLPSSPHNSMAAVAAQAVGTADRVAVLGSGIMATAVVEGLMLLPAPPRVTVIARHPEKVAERPDVEVRPFDEIAHAIVTFPAVVSATSAKNSLVDDEAITSSVADRTGPLLLIDMAMPPDFHTPSSDGITYIDIDDLARMADRRSRSDEADALVATAAADAYRQYRDHHEVGPLIGRLMSESDEIVDDAVSRFSGRLTGQGDEEVVRQAAHTVARTLLARPVNYLKGENRAPEAIDVIADAFGIDDE